MTLEGPESTSARVPAGPVGAVTAPVLSPPEPPALPEPPSAPALPPESFESWEPAPSPSLVPGTDVDAPKPFSERIADDGAPAPPAEPAFVDVSDPLGARRFGAASLRALSSGSL